MKVNIKKQIEKSELYQFCCYLKWIPVVPAKKKFPTAHTWEKFKLVARFIGEKKNNTPWGSSSNCFSPPHDPCLILCFLGFAHKQVTFETIQPGPYSSWACTAPHKQSLFWIFWSLAPSSKPILFLG